MNNNFKMLLIRLKIFQKAFKLNILTQNRIVKMLSSQNLEIKLANQFTKLQRI